MIGFAQQLVPLATNIGKAFQKHTERSSSGTGDVVLILIGIAAVVSAVIAGIYYLERRKALQAVKVDSEQLLFRELCRIHSLSSTQSTLLLALVESRGAKRCDVFVDPAILDTAIAGGHAERYAPIKEKLFGEDEESSQKVEPNAEIEK